MNNPSSYTLTLAKCKILFGSTTKIEKARKAAADKVLHDLVLSMRSNGISTVCSVSVNTHLCPYLCTRQEKHNPSDNATALIPGENSCNL